MAETNKNKTERNRRTSKKLYEKVDEIFEEVMNDPEFSKQIVQDWAKEDPRGFMQLMEKRLPKVQPVDQDLQRTLISLKSMMMDLPDVEDVAKAFKKCRIELSTALRDLKNAIEEKDFWRTKYLTKQKNE